MRIRPLSLVVASLLAAPALSDCPAGGASTLISVEFIGMAAPATSDEKADAYSRAVMRATCSDGTTTDYPLRYHQIFATSDRVGPNMVGGLFNSAGGALTDNDGQMASDAPDGTSLMRIDGLSVPGAAGNSLAMVTQFEYRELPPNDGSSTGPFWSKLPAAMGLTLLDQDQRSGLLTAKSYRSIDLSGVNGGWIHCGSTLSGWNTHVGSEEYEPDAKVHGGGARASDSDDRTDIASFSRYYFGDAGMANPYHYGLVPEVTVGADGKARVVKHSAPGRYAREMQIAAADGRTAIGGDDGKNTGLFMFVADTAADLTAGTLYAAKATQTSADDGGGFELQWIRLGHASDAEIKGLVDGGIKFSDIFDASNTDPGDSSYRRVVTYTGTEWLRLKPGMEKAAAFLETRRYAALMGATTEFSKMEYVAYNKANRKFYIAISRVEAGMTDERGDIRVPRNDAGIVFEMTTEPARKDTSGTLIYSDFVGTHLTSIPELVGGWLGMDSRDAEGNSCSQDRICGPDNLVYVDSIRTLFIGEDTSRRNNNYVWAYNIDTGRLSRILSLPMAAEASGLMVAGDYHGRAYIMSNFQHPGEEDLKGYSGADKAEVLARINSKWGAKRRAAIGYLGTADGALPAFE
ncbi:MAG: DUF839 domain-containing protein [Thiocapsa sp.]|nr:alkaline phosphatase PhoX [Thiocapsa sp.]MCG6897416.1 DUF839 domain-containing protein [Thiocapsa sp.]